MKIKNLLLASLVAFGFASCSSDSDNNLNPPASISGDIKLSVDVSSIATRTEDIGVDDGAKSDINSVDVYLLEDGPATGNPQKVHSSLTITTDEEIDELIAGEYIIEKINGNITGLALVVNKVEGTERIADGTLETELKSKALVSVINDIQPTAKFQGVSNAHMYGFAETITKLGTTNSTTGNELYEAAVELVPTIARVQIFGEPLFGKSIKNAKVTKIFLDHFNTDSNKDDKFNVGKVVGDDLITALDPYKFFDFNNEGLKLFENKTSGVYAYHLFPQETVSAEKPKDRGVKLILEFVYDIVSTDGETVKSDVVEYATLRFATVKSGSKPGKDKVSLDDADVAIKEAQVYTLHLGVIDWTGDGEFVHPETPGVEDKDKDEYNPGDGGETPNADQKDLKVLVTIQDWTEVIIVPQN